MSEETYWLDSAPALEQHAQVGDPDYLRDARAECVAFIAAIRKVVGREPEGARLVIKSQDHEFGEYLTVAVIFDGDDEWASRYAARCDADAPTTWEEAGVEPPVRRANHR